MTGGWSIFRDAGRRRDGEAPADRCAEALIVAAGFPDGRTPAWIAPRVTALAALTHS